jgi:hypothetical protein
MLFCHSGCEVKIALIDNGHEWVSESVVRQISNSAALTATHRPGWFFAPLAFDLAIAVAPASLTQQLLQARLTSDPVLEFILQKSPTLWLLQEPAHIPEETDDCDPRLIFRPLPAQPQQLSTFFQKIFAECTAWLANRRKNAKKSFWLNYQIPEQLKIIANLRPAWLARFDHALRASGLSQSASLSDADLVIDAYDGPQLDANNRLVFAEPEPPAHPQLKADALHIVFVAPELPLESLATDEKRLLAQRQNNSLHVADRHGTRVIPDLTGQCCFARFSSQLVSHLNRTLSEREQQA